MPKNLVTEWKRIGRSGPTVDGRNIEPAALEQAAKNYKKDLFTALIWPDHIRWFNMGTVEELRAEPNNEEGVDLFARISPNQFYIDSNKHGQRLFTSMELQPNFRDTGEYYLTGLAATDNPASAATSEMRFSSLDSKDALVSTFVENTPKTFNDDQPPGWFTKLFKPEPNEDDMNKQALEALAERFTALEQKLQSFGTTETNADSGDDSGTDDYSGLATKVDKLTEQVKALTDMVAADESPDNQFKQLADELKALREEFNQAVSDEQGTDAGEHVGDDENLDDYI